MVFMEFSRNLKKYIFERGLKLTDISEATGIPTSTLSEWTAGRAPKISASLLKLCTFLNVSLDDLVSYNEHSSKAQRPSAQTHVTLDGHQYRIQFEKLKSNK